MVTSTLAYRSIHSPKGASQHDQKQITLLIIVSAASLIIGITIGFIIGTNPFKNDARQEDNQYKSICNLLVSKGHSDQASISSSDLIIDLPQSVLQLDNIYAAIVDRYPNAQFTLTLEHVNGSPVFSLVAASESPEDLTEICNMAAALLCEEIESTMEQVSCKILDLATQPTPQKAE